MPLSRSASEFRPAARSPSMTWSWVAPAGSRLEMAPSKIRLVPWPSSLGPSTLNPTLAMLSRSIPASPSRCGFSRAASFRAEGMKFSAFSAGSEGPNRGPRPGPGMGRGRCVPGLRVAHAASSAVSWDSTISA